MAKHHKDKQLLTSYRSYVVVPAFVTAGTLVAAITLVALYAYTNALGFLIALSAVSLVTLIGYVIFYLRVSKTLEKTYYNKLYKVTLDNLEKIRNNDTNLKTYGSSDFKEIQSLNRATHDIKTKLNSSYLVVKDPDYSKIDLEYIDRKNSLITFKSFRNNIQNIIFVSQSFRNVLIEVYFDLPNDVRLTETDKNRLLDLYSRTFMEHKNVLFMFDDDKSMIIYVPVIDSFSEIKERLSYAVSDSSVMVRDDKGIRNILAQYAVVAYPYSNEDMILGDLRYAKRQNKPYYLFLPIRHKENIGASLMLNTTMNLNYMSKVMMELSELDYSAKDNDKNKNILTTVFTAVTNFLDIDEGGIFVYDDIADSYYSYVASDRSNVFEKKDLSKEFVTALADAADEDGSYYFSNKKHANYAVKRQLDMYGINAGEYYIVKNFEDDKITAVIYLFNKNKDMILNTYLRETFFMMALRIDAYFEKREIANYADSKATENDSILALSRLYVYHIDENYKLTYISKGLKRKFPKLQLGEYCHKFFFGNEKPCKDCPLIVGKKKYFEDRGSQFESSLVLKDRKDRDNVMLVKQLNNLDEIGDLYQQDLLIYSFKSLVSLIKNEYASNARGYILLLSIDNYEDIIKAKGSEGYSYYAREYIRMIKNKLQTEDVYYYSPSAFAVHLPFIGHADTINKIETIFPLSKSKFFEMTDFKELKVTYLPVGYPRGYALPEDFIKHISDFYRNPKAVRNKDFIYFADFSISRSANKREFILSVLDQEFSGNNSTSMNLQPIVSLKDGHIFGAEILLRIADAHRNVFFNATEISRIAEQENKTQLITKSIINFIGNMYSEYGKNIFRINNFNRMAINIDQTYLKDSSLLTELIKLSEENKLPNGFISMEIPEDVIPNFKSQIKSLADELSKYKIMFSCDRYLGQYVNIEELHQLGFNEVKVARDIILTIDKDPAKYETMKSIVTMSKKFNINVAAVGVENEQQLKMLKSLDDEMMVQGYYLYKPLTRSDLIAALISYEK